MSSLRLALSGAAIGWTAAVPTNVRFADTNVLLYAVSKHPAEERKATIAAAILGGGDVAISVQVLQEFYVQATRLSRPDPLTSEQATRLAESFLRFRVVETTTDLALAAMATQRRVHLSYWDAAIIEAARMSGCAAVLSEDLADGQSYGGVTVEDPFKS